MTGNSAETHTMEKLGSSLNLDRRRCVFLAFALGCDFCPQGIPGLGKETLRALLDIWPLEWDPIKIVKMWQTQGFRPDRSSLPKTSAFRCNECSDVDSSLGVHCDNCTGWQRKVFNDTPGQTFLLLFLCSHSHVLVQGIG